jgi:threonine aldolase
LAQLQEIGELAKRYHLSVHMDGARLWNASVATGVAVDKIAAVADTVTFCLSKGLGAPVGSMLCGTETFISQARAIRKMLGGGMRQAGILAAAGLFALDHHVDRLAEDHANARKIALTLMETGWAKVVLENVQTNIIFFSAPGFSGTQVEKTLVRHGILCFGDHKEVRLVTNLDLSAEDADAVCDILRKLTLADFCA